MNTYLRMIPEIRWESLPKQPKQRMKRLTSDITGNKTRGVLTHQTVWWNFYRKLLKHDFYTWGKFFVKLQNGKNPTKLEIIYWIKIKRREARQNSKEERKKKQLKEKDYRRLRSVNENEKKVQEKKNEKRRLH